MTDLLLLQEEVCSEDCRYEGCVAWHGGSKYFCILLFDIFSQVPF
jgi:hypothetical protein